MEFDKEIILEINKLIACKNTDAITFVLSDKNQIILNAIGNNKVVNNWGLKRFDKQVKKQRNYPTCFGKDTIKKPLYYQDI